MNIKLVVIAGVRPQFIKVAALQRGIDRWNRDSPIQIDAFYINTGQHHDDELAGSLIRELHIHFDREYSYESQRPIDVLACMIVNITDTLDRLTQQKGFDWVVVFGDANATLAGAIAAARGSHPLAHIEAGGRSGSRDSPEGINRVVVDHLATVHFVSSRQDVHNLAKEGLNQHVIWTGDILFDLVKEHADSLRPGYSSFTVGEYVLASIHHGENLNYNETMRSILEALSGQPRPVLFVAHPRTRKKLQELGLWNFDNIKLVSPLTYHQMMSALKGCAFAFTDSGGLQREAYYLGKRCLIRQDEPFWPCLIHGGIHKAVSGNLQDIRQGLRWIENALMSQEYPTVDDLGSGNAVNSILDSIVRLTTAPLTSECTPPG